MRALLLGVAALLATSCASWRAALPFRVVPADPNYLLRSPDLKDIAFPDVLGAFTGVGAGWVDLRPAMDLRVENAYYQEGAPKHGLNGFLGTEIARYRTLNAGLRLIAVESRLERRPEDQAAVQELVRAEQRRYRYHRFFYQVVFKSKGEIRGAVLLGAGSKLELDRLGGRLVEEPDSVCGERLAHCTVFPEVCSVSVEIGIMVNGNLNMVVWGSVVGSVAPKGRRVELRRLHAGRLTAVEIDSGDANAMRLPLLPGDWVSWE